MRIIVFKPRGFAAPKIMQGFVDAFRELAHEVLVIDNRELFNKKKVQEAIRAIVLFGPDFVIGYGVSAIIPVGNSHCMELLGIPSLHYFADDPFHPGTKADIALISRDRLSTILIWDRSYVDPLNETGCKNIHFLPLAVNTNCFRKLKAEEYEHNKYACNVSFAGNGDLEGRLPYIEAIADLGIAVYGDEYRWRQHADKTPVMRCYRGFLREEKEICALYNAARINLNITARQGKASANLSVFNITASGGFLLTDYKEGIEELFDIGTEIECYRSREELRAKIEYYLEHDAERVRIAEAGRLRAIKQHSYLKRAAELLEYIKTNAINREVAVKI